MTVHKLPQNLESTINREHYRYISPAEQYFVHDVLKMKSDISDGLGAPDIKLLACLALCYILLFLSMCKGVKSSGKVLIFPSIKSMTVYFYYHILSNLSHDIRDYIFRLLISLPYFLTLSFLH